MKKVAFVLALLIACNLFTCHLCVSNAQEQIIFKIEEPKVLDSSVCFQVLEMNSPAGWERLDFFVAGYKSGGLIALGKEEQPDYIANGEKPEIAVEVQNAEDADYYKLFVWYRNYKMRSFMSVKEFPNPKKASVSSITALYLKSSLDLEGIAYTEAPGSIKIAFKKIDASISGLACFSAIAERADIACADDTGAPLDSALFNTDISTLETKVPYVKFTVTNKTAAQDKIDIIVTQSNEGVLIKGEPSVAVVGNAYAYQLCGGTSYAFEGSLPGGLTLSSGGLISGVPSAAAGETCEFNVIASNGGKTGKRRLALHVLPNVFVDEALKNENTYTGFSLSVPQGTLSDISSHTIVAETGVPTNFDSGEAPLSCLNVNILDNNGQPVESFDKPLVMTLHFNPSSVPEGEIPVVAYYDNGWQRVPADVDMQAGTAMITTGHLSFWGLFSDKKPVTLYTSGNGWQMSIKYDPNDFCIVGNKQLRHRYLADIIISRYEQFFYGPLSNTFTRTIDDKKVSAFPTNVAITIMDSGQYGVDGCASSGGYISLNGSNYEAIEQFYNALYHELFHLIQMNYVGTLYSWFNLWFTESTADCVAAAYTQKIFPTASGRNYMALDNSPLPASWFEDITKCDKKNEYMGSYFIAYLANNNMDYRRSGDKVIPFSLSAVPGWTANFYSYLKDNYSNISGTVLDCLKSYGNKEDSLLGFAERCFFGFEAQSPLESTQIKSVDILTATDADESGNIIPDIMEIELPEPGVRFVKINKVDIEGMNFSPRVSASVPDGSNCDLRLMAYVSGGWWPRSPISDNLFNRSFALSSLDGNEYYLMLSTFSKTKNPATVSLGNLGALTENNVSLEYLVMPHESESIEDNYDVYITPTYNTDGANIYGEIVTTIAPINLGYGPAGKTFEGVMYFAVQTVGGLAVGEVCKKYSYTIPAQD